MSSRREDDRREDDRREAELDVFLLGSGSRRPVLTTVMDVRTRQFLSWRVDPPRDPQPAD